MNPLHAHENAPGSLHIIGLSTLFTRMLLMFAYVRLAAAGGAGSEYSLCPIGSDCIDCGPRSNAPSPTIPAISASMSDTLDSSNWPGHDFSAAACIDGVYGLGDAGWSFCNSNTGQTNPWLSVQIPSGSFVDHVFVHARSDCCTSYLSPFEIYVGNAAGDPVSGGLTRCGLINYPPNTIGPHRVDCGLVGSYVTLRLPFTNRMIAIDGALR